MASQYGSGFKGTTWIQAGRVGSALSIISAVLTGYAIGETIDSYYFGYVQYRNKH